MNDPTSYELGRLAERVRQHNSSQTDLDVQLVRASEAGATLAQLAEALGVGTPQGARSRLVTARARLDEEGSGER
jgi:alkylhydroperoxidase/carboxymuconolactone decarboxylase family protein YurZ